VVAPMWNGARLIRVVRCGTKLSRSHFTHFGGLRMASENTAPIYRLYAAECVEIARSTQDPGNMTRLLAMAQAWLALADQADKNSEAPILVYQTPLPR
jgi:hypothetical protein